IEREMSVYTFGLGVNGALGHGDEQSQNLPKKIQYFGDNNKRIKRIACGSYHTVFITDDDELYMTGISQDPKNGTTLFYGRTGTTEPLTTGSDTSSQTDDRKLSITASESGGNSPPTSAADASITAQQQHPQPHPQRIDEDKRTETMEGISLITSIWMTDVKPPVTTPIRISLDFLQGSPHSSVKQVALGNYHIVILTEGGNVWSWGSNSNGQLGIGLDVHSNTPRMVELKCVKHIATGVKHTAAINEWGELYMWGINDHGELGLGDTGHRRLPTRVSKLKSEYVTMVACSSTHSVCCTDSGKMYSWGQCDKLGKIQTVPTVLPFQNHLEGDADGGGCGGGGEVRQIACGEWQIAALTQLGEVYLWEVGGRPTPIHHLLAQHSVRSITMGNFHLVCLTDKGQVITLGRNKSGQLGRILASTEQGYQPGLVKELCHDEETATTKVGLPDKDFVIQIQAGEYHSVALVHDAPKTKALLNLLKVQRNYLRQLNILSKIYYKSMMTIATPSDPLVTSLLQQTASGQNPSSHPSAASIFNTNQVNNPYITPNSPQFGSTPPSPASALAPPSSPSNPHTQAITSSSSASSPNLMSPSGSSTVRLRTASMATIRGLFGLNALSSMSTEETSITEEEVSGIFCDLTLLIRSTQIFLSRLDSRLDNWDVINKVVGDIFLDDNIMSNYRVYIPFSDNYNSACMTLFNARKRTEKLTTLLKECEKRSQSFGIRLDQSLVQDMDLKSLLLAPLQNIPRLYIMLKKHKQDIQSLSTHKDSELLNQAAGKFQVLLERMNQNFQFVDAVEILNCSSNEYGNPQIMGGSLAQLVDKLTHHNISDPNFGNVFLLTFRAFTTPLHLMDMLYEKYEKTPAVKNRVLNILTAWIVNHFYDFENDPIQEIMDLPNHHPSSLSVRMEDWIKTSNNTLMNSVKKEYEKQRGRVTNTNINHAQQSVESRLNSLSVKIPIPASTPTISLLDFSSMEIAQTITVLNHLYFAKIDKREFLNQAWAKKKAPNIQASTDHFNRLSQLVVSEIVQQKMSKQRAATLSHFVAVAQNCFELNNFTGVAAIIYGLNSGPISRLKKTWSKLSKDTMNTFEYLEKVVTPLKNYISLRHLMATVQPPCTPFLGIYLKDLTFTEDGNPSVIGGLINFYKAP
ncbi:hypothetical protein SAMD00019534_009680, partial [Acytostelium subglobosum LB1]|uniref:hypothetical protein n=1 Tax=Acytostelium subglobosum LB1 TaxID=1410327 RepID=UPI000644EC7B